MRKDSNLLLAKINFFDKPNDQSQTRLSFGMARKSELNNSTQNYDKDYYYNRETGNA
jgi:hypothetical protein